MNTANLLTLLLIEDTVAKLTQVYLTLFLSTPFWQGSTHSALLKGGKLEFQSTSKNAAEAEAATGADKKRLNGLWVGLGLYFVIMLFAVQYATRVPYQVLALGGLINMSIIICFFVAINKVRRRIRTQGQLESKGVSGAPMKYEGFKKLRWLFFALAVIGIAYTPSAILTVFTNAMSDHRLIIPFAGALVIRLLFIGFSLKIWWETGKKSGATPNPDGPTAD